MSIDNVRVDAGLGLELNELGQRNGERNCRLAILPMCISSLLTDTPQLPKSRSWDFYIFWQLLSNIFQIDTIFETFENPIMLNWYII